MLPRSSLTRCLALDLGDRRIGVASGTLETGLSQPLEVIVRDPGDRDVWRRLREIVRRENAGQIVVGDPVNMNGSVGEQALAARRFARRLRNAIRQAKVELFDERLSSFSADEWMLRDGIKPAKRRQVRDAYAAAVILRDYFASRPGSYSIANADNHPV